MYCSVVDPVRLKIMCGYMVGSSIKKCTTQKKLPFLEWDMAKTLFMGLDPWWELLHIKHIKFWKLEKIDHI